MNSTVALSIICVAVFATLALSQPLEQPRNLLRNSHFLYSANGEVPDWWGTGAPERIRNFSGCISLEEASPIAGTKALRLFNPQANALLWLQSFAYALPSERVYTFSVYLRSDRDNFPVTLRIGDQSTKVNVSTQWQRFSFTAKPIRGHWARGRLIVSIGFSQIGTLWISAPQLEEGETATDYSPLYRDDVFLPNRSQPFRATVQFNAYMTEPEMRIWCENNFQRPVQVRCRVGETTLHGKATLKAGERKFVSFNIADLPAGTFTVTVEAIDGEGKVLATATESLRKLPPNEKVGAFVQIDKVRRHLVVNGKPIILFAQGIHANPEEWWLDDIAQHGFNAIVTFVPTDQSRWEQIRKFLDEAHNRNLKVIAWLSAPRKSAKEIAEALAKTIASFREHPSIVAWYLLDEPEGWWAQEGRKEDELLIVYQMAKLADPYRPAQLNWYSWADGKGGYGSLNASDFGSLDHYPFGKTENPFTALGGLLWRMNRDCRPLGKPVSFWQQMYGYDDAVREPTAREARAHTWLTLVNGGKLIYWFIYKPMGESFWNAMPKIAEEVRSLEKLLTADDATELAVGREGNLYYSLWNVNGEDVLLVVNAGYTPTNTPIFVRWLIGRGVKEAKLIIGDDGLIATGDIVWVSLPPLAAGAFKLL